MLETKRYQELRRAYVSRNPEGHFFDVDTMRFFNSRVSNVTKNHDTQEFIFITSEKHDQADRAYTLRVLSMTGAIKSVGEFQQFETLNQAKRAKKEYLIK